MKSGSFVSQFEVYVIELDPTIGTEIKKTRPCVIVSPDAINSNLTTVIVAPLTHTIKSFPSRVYCNFNEEDGQIVLDQIRAIDKKRLKKKIGKIDAATGEHIKTVLQTMFS
ncbi:MAG: endoribonuclease MazF [Bacteroidota bacterium]